MDVQEIQGLGEFEQLRGGWDEVFAADQHASVFMSWPWLRGWFEVTPYPWSVLAVRREAAGPWLGFLPISYRGSRTPLRFDHMREVHMAGEPAADHAGLVCRSDAEEQVLSALADHLANHMPWERLRFDELADSRMSRLAEKLGGDFRAIDRQGTACPYVELPDTWDDYLTRRLGYATRKSLRRRMKAVERQFRVERLNGSNHDRQIDGLMALANARRRPDQDPNTGRLHAPLRRCAPAGLLWMLMLWKDDTPVAGQACFIDRKQDSLCLYLTSYDQRFGDLSPGRVVNALCIRDAIETLGLGELDFLRGEEPYKFQFGAHTRHNRTLIVERNGLGSTIRRRVSALRDRLSGRP